MVIEDSDLYRPTDWSSFRSVLDFRTVILGFLRAGASRSPYRRVRLLRSRRHSGRRSRSDHRCGMGQRRGPNAAIEMASCADTTTNFGGFIALQNLLNSASAPPAIVSISYGDSEAEVGAAFNALYQRSVSAGRFGGRLHFRFRRRCRRGEMRSGRNQCDARNRRSAASPPRLTTSPSAARISAIPSPEPPAPTGTPTNTVHVRFGKVLYSRDSVERLLRQWLDRHLSRISPPPTAQAAFATQWPRARIYSPPAPAAAARAAAQRERPRATASWEAPARDMPSRTGNPSWAIRNDGVRDIPDVSLFAADGFWGHYYVVCWSDLNQGGRLRRALLPLGRDLEALPFRRRSWPGSRRWSIRKPANAGQSQSRLLRSGRQRIRQRRQQFLQLDARQRGGRHLYLLRRNARRHGCELHGSCQLLHALGHQWRAFHVELRLSTGLRQHVGWDFATGIGTVNAYNLVENWPQSGITANSGTPQTAVIGMQYAAPLVAKVSDASGNPVSGVTVTFAAPASGASGYVCRWLECGQ